MLDMWRAYVGESAMRHTIQKYLSAHRNRAVSTDVFWNTFGTSQASAYEHAWLDGFGTPILRASARCAAGKQHVDVEQQPIRSDFSAARKETLWPIPISLRVGTHNAPYLLTTRRASIDAGSCGTRISLNEGLRPPYMTVASHIDPGNSATDRLRVFSDTQYLYNARLATIADLNAALTAYAPKAAGLFRLRYALRYLTVDAALLRGSPLEARFDASVQAWALPLEARTRTLEPKSGDVNARGELLQLLSWMPTSAIEHVAQATYDAQTAQPGFYQDGWGNGALAAQDAKSQRVTQVTQVVSQPEATISAKEAFLLSVTGDTNVVASVLAWASTRRDFALYVSSLGARNPQTVSNYLELHAHDILVSAPPTQQAWTLTSCVVNGAWSARSPEAWRMFFERHLSQRDRALINNAVKQIATKWAQRHGLERQLSQAM